MPYWILTLSVAALVAIGLFAFAMPLALWVLPVVLVVIALVGAARAVQGRRSPEEERRT